MEEERPLTFYNTMGLSKVQVQISKRHKFDINVVVVKREQRDSASVRSRTVHFGNALFGHLEPNPSFALVFVQDDREVKRNLV